MLVRRQVVKQLYGGGMGTAILICYWTGNLLPDLGRHTPKEVLAIAEKNLFALSTQLGASKVFFSNTDVSALARHYLLRWSDAADDAEEPRNRRRVGQVSELARTAEGGQERIFEEGRIIWYDAPFY